MDGKRLYQLRPAKAAPGRTTVYGEYRQDSAVTLSGSILVAAGVRFACMRTSSSTSGSS